jgi:adenine/guanine phosphoribosyltransferase-like PRPP-binding protein
MMAGRGMVVVAVLLCALLGGCASDVANRYYGLAKYPPKDPSEVELLWKRPERDFVVIADFQSRGETAEAIREKAARIGADAVIIAVLGGLYSGQWAGENKYADTYSRITGTAIKYK